MLQYYLRAAGIALSWVGTGRLIFSLDYGDADFEAIVERFAAAARAMRDDGWWWTDAALTDKSIRRGILREIIGKRLAKGS
jgi:glutamate-1-semialdehyde 2,1-aminomutase